MTQKFFGSGGAKNTKTMKFLESYEAGKRVDVAISAVVYVPERILTGICFPPAEVDN